MSNLSDIMPDGPNPNVDTNKVASIGAPETTETEVIPTPVSTPTPGATMTVEAARAMFGDAVIDSAEEVVCTAEDMMTHDVKTQLKNRDETEKSEMDELFGDVINEEAERLKETGELLKNEEFRESIKDPKAAADANKVTYTRTEAAPKRMKTMQVPVETDEDDVLADLLPSYSDDEDAPQSVVDVDDNPEAEVEEDENEFDFEVPEPPERGSPPEAFEEYFGNMSVASPAPMDNSPVKVTKTQNLNVVPKSNVNTLGDQAFANAVNRFKKDNFSSVRVPLVNSGIFVDIVGTGVVDLTNLYLNVDENMSKAEYNIAQMGVVLKAVTGAYPKVDPVNLRSTIHFQDFQLMAYGHICATLNEVETVTNCTRCNMPFRIRAKSKELLQNAEEISLKANLMETDPDITKHSCLSNRTTITGSGGMEVVIGHPSYSEMIKSMSSYSKYMQTLDQSTLRVMSSMIEILYMVRSIKLANGTPAANLHQMCIALGMLTQEHYHEVTDCIRKAGEGLITPEFGINEIACPHCGTINTDVKYDDLMNLVFYHTTVTKYTQNSNQK